MLNKQGWVCVSLGSSWHNNLFHAETHEEKGYLWYVADYNMKEQFDCQPQFIALDKEKIFSWHW